ncbi:MAG: hypothetical protein JWO02_1627 [Solirubrobacterales bacterium]|nr:hypothetical protein [Solirubrobacterales bacterium]
MRDATDGSTIGFWDDNPQAALFQKRLWKACIYCWPVCLITFLIFFLPIAGFIPPPKENWSADRLAEFYSDNLTGIRIGLIGSMFASALMLPFFTVISAEMKKIEGRMSLLAPIQFGAAMILVAFFQIIALFWLVSSLRPGRDPEVIRAFNDYGWLVWTILIPTYSLQFICMAVAGFMDRRPEPIWPRWASYVNIWVAITGAGGVLAVFFHSGPFSWNGIMGYWIPVIAFAAGMSMTAVLLLRRMRYEEGLEAATAEESATPAVARRSSAAPTQVPAGAS